MMLQALRCIFFLLRGVCQVDLLSVVPLWCAHVLRHFTLCALVVHFLYTYDSVFALDSDLVLLRTHVSKYS